MKCLICGKEYIALGVHIRRKHQIDPDDYREEFGMLRTAALVDDELAKTLSTHMKRRLADPEYLSEAQERCHANAKKLVGKPGPGMSDAGKAMIADRNKARNALYLQSRTEEVAGILLEHKSIHAVRKALGMGTDATKAIIAQFKTGYSKDAALDLRLQQATATQHAKRAVRVEAFKKAAVSAKSAAEACRLAGITKTTYKHWLKAGVIEKQPRIRG
jgi:hypothetical protein